jgi:hypothetical protein
MSAHMVLTVVLLVLVLYMFVLTLAAVPKHTYVTAGDAAGSPSLDEFNSGDLTIVRDETYTLPTSRLNGSVLVTNQVFEGADSSKLLLFVLPDPAKLAAGTWLKVKVAHLPSDGSQLVVRFADASYASDGFNATNLRIQTTDDHDEGGLDSATFVVVAKGAVKSWQMIGGLNYD